MCLNLFRAVGVLILVNIISFSGLKLDSCFWNCCGGVVCEACSL